MSKKNKKKKGKAESSNKTRILLRLQKYQAFSPQTAKSMKELGFADTKKFERHLEVLESDKIIKREESGDTVRYWANKDKIKPKKTSNTTLFILFWLGSTVVIFLIIYVLFGPKG